jgi:hypothetical protein
MKKYQNLQKSLIVGFENITKYVGGTKCFI